MATSSTVEAERKFDAEASTPLPALDTIDGVASVGAPETHTLEAIYFDTRHLALAARGISLRRRTGGHDAGWHLKLPLSPGKRTEIHAPLGNADTVPDELMDRILAYTREGTVAAVATLTTERTSYALYGSHGGRLADFVDDHVHAHVSVGEPREMEWREWEVELAAQDGADDSMLDNLTGQLAEAGAKPSERTSKLATALGGSWPDAKGTAGTEYSNGKAAVAPVISFLQTQMADLLFQDAHVRLGQDDSVHQMRSVIRRLRSVLHSYRTLFEPAAVEERERELKSLAKILGHYRDIEVLHARLRKYLEELPEELVLGPLREELDQRMAARADTAMGAVRNHLTSPRYFRLLDELEAFIADPPVTARGEEPARKTVAKLVNKAAKRLGKRHDAAVGAAVGPERDAAFHEVRKAAKKLRFAAAAAESTHGKRASKVEAAAHKLQSILGDHQDSVMARAELLDLGSAPGIGSAAFTYGVLHAMERSVADATETQYLRHSRKALKLRLKKPTS